VLSLAISYLFDNLKPLARAWSLVKIASGPKALDALAAVRFFVLSDLEAG